MTLPDGTVLQEVNEEEYCYLGILEADKILYNKQMKEAIARTYLQQAKKLLKSSWMVSLLFKQSTSIIDNLTLYSLLIAVLLICCDT